MTGATSAKRGLGPWIDNALSCSLQLAALYQCVLDDIDHWHLEHVVRQLASRNSWWCRCSRHAPSAQHLAPQPAIANGPQRTPARTKVAERPDQMTLLPIVCISAPTVMEPLVLLSRPRPLKAKTVVASGLPRCSKPFRATPSEPSNGFSAQLSWLLLLVVLTLANHVAFCPVCSALPCSMPFFQLRPGRLWHLSKT